MWPSKVGKLSEGQLQRRVESPPFCCPWRMGLKTLVFIRMSSLLEDHYIEV